jgi:hypothetical protein
MKPEIQELIKAERHQSDFGFITEVIQRGRIKPAKFIHSLKIPMHLYEEMRDKGVIKPENYYIHESAFFEFRHEKVIISFVCRGLCDDLQFAIDHYLIVEYSGNYPIERTYSSKMNFDKHIEPVMLLRTKTGKKSHV